MASTAAMAESSSRGLEIHELVAEEVLLAVGRHPGEGFGNGGGRGDGIAAETVHQAGQHRNGRLVAIHQDLLAFPHILQQGWGDGGQVEGKEFVGVKALPFGGPVDGQDFGPFEFAAAGGRGVAGARYRFRCWVSCRALSFTSNLVPSLSQINKLLAIIFQLTPVIILHIMIFNIIEG